MTLAAEREFIEAAREFMRWCGSPEGDEEAEARALLRLLSQLQQRVLALPETNTPPGDVEGMGTTDAEWRRVYERCAALPLQYYPTGDDALGDLADDVADIHRDLKRGLSLLDAGERDAALWEFTFGHRHHWGEHAAGAARALGTWLDRRGP